MAVVGPHRLGLAVVEVDDELSVFNPATGRAMLLNQTATAVWRLCDGTLDEEQIVSLLATSYAQPADVLRGEVLHTIEMFRDERMFDEPDARP